MPTSTLARTVVLAALLVPLVGNTRAAPPGPGPVLGQADDPEPIARPQPRPEAEQGSSAAWVVLLLPTVLIVAFIYLMLRRQRGMLTHVDESMVVSRKMLQLMEESVALQRETVRLLTPTRKSPGSP